MQNRIPPVKDWNKSVSQLNILINEWIFDETHRDIVRRRLLNGEDFESISKSCNLSYEWVRDIYYIERRQLFNHIDDLPPK